MKIVVLDGFTLNPGDLTWDELKKYGELTVYDRTTYNPNEEEIIIERAQDAEIIFTNKTPISSVVLEKLPKLKFICVLATGFNVVDVEAAKKHNIIVTNIPTYGTAAVAQMAFALLLEICHHVWAHSEEVKKGSWTNSGEWCFWNYPLIELDGKTIGVIGYGRIGQAVGKIAQAFGMNVLAYDLYQNKELENCCMRYTDLNKLISESDIISLHCPLSESNKGIINKKSIALMRDGVIILNNSRGALIVEEDLAEALDQGKVSGAAVDVVSSEPIMMDNPLLRAKNCIITPHISWAPKESRKRLMSIAVDNLKQFLEKNPVNVVNK
jgi:glycerate dehydrogenase